MITQVWPEVILYSGDQRIRQRHRFRRLTVFTPPAEEELWTFADVHLRVATTTAAVDTGAARAGRHLCKQRQHRRQCPKRRLGQNNISYLLFVHNRYYGDNVVVKYANN